MSEEKSWGNYKLPEWPELYLRYAPISTVLHYFSIVICMLAVDIPVLLTMFGWKLNLSIIVLLFSIVFIFGIVYYVTDRYADKKMEHRMGIRNVLIMLEYYEPCKFPFEEYYWVSREDIIEFLEEAEKYKPGCTGNIMRYL